MRDRYRPSFVCSDCKSDVYGSVWALPHRLLCDECLALPHTLLCAECLWIRILMPNPTERAEMRADETRTRAAFAALAANLRSPRGGRVARQLSPTLPEPRRPVSQAGAGHPAAMSTGGEA